MKAIRITAIAIVILVVLTLILIASQAGCVRRTPTPSSYDLTATYGAEILHIQLTAIEESRTPTPGGE